MHESDGMHTNSMYRLELSTWGTGRFAVGSVVVTSDNHGRQHFHRLSMTYCAEEALWEEVGAALTLIRAQLLQHKDERDYQPDISGLVRQQDHDEHKG